MKQLWCSSIMQDSHYCNPGLPVDVSFDDDDGKIVLKNCNYDFVKGFRMSLILVKNRKLKNFIKTEKTYCVY